MNNFKIYNNYRTITTKEKNKFLIEIYFWIFSFILWSYMFSVHIYKIWYIVTAVALFICYVLLMTKVLSFYDINKGPLYLFVYFCYIFLTSLWAKYPEITLRYASYDLIEFFVFILAYILTLNSPIHKIEKFFKFLIIPVIASTLYFYFSDPNAIRIGGGRNLMIMPMLLPFFWMDVVEKKGISNKFAIVSIVVILCLMIISMSRSPVLVGTIVMILSLISFSKSFHKIIKSISKILIYFLILLSMLFYYSPTKIAILKQYSRIINKDVVFGNIHIQAEGSGRERKLIEKGVNELFFDNQPFGIGYMNFPEWFKVQYNGQSHTIHSIYYAWSLECGIFFIIFLIYVFYKYFEGLYVAIKLSKDERFINTCKAITISMVGILVYGLFHQAHQAPILFLLLGVGFALKTKFNTNLRRND